jgi:hypothetical protein
VTSAASRMSSGGAVSVASASPRSGETGTSVKAGTSSTLESLSVARSHPCLSPMESISIDAPFSPLQPRLTTDVTTRMPVHLEGLMTPSIHKLQRISEKTAFRNPESIANRTGVGKHPTPTTPLRSTSFVGQAAGSGCPTQEVAASFYSGSPTGYVRRVSL